MNIYNDIQITKETDDDGERFLLRLDGKRIIANTFRECLKAMGLIHALPQNCRGKTVDVITAGRRVRRNQRKEEIVGVTKAGPVDSPHTKPVRSNISPENPLLGQWLNRIHHGDCIETMNSMPEKSIDLMVTSPPYNIRNSTGGGMKTGSGGLWGNSELQNGYDGHADDMPYDEYVAWQRACLDAMMRLLKDDGAIFYNHKWRVQDGLLQDRQDIVEGLPHPLSGHQPLVMFPSSPNGAQAWPKTTSTSTKSNSSPSRPPRSTTSPSL